MSNGELVVVTRPGEAEVPCEPCFSGISGRPGPRSGRVEIEAFLQGLAEKTPYQLDCDVVAILGEELECGCGAEDKAISALVKRGASISKENKQKLLSAARAYGEKLKSYLHHNPTQDHGDMDWVEAAYYDGEKERTLTKRLATVPVKM